MNRAMDEQSTVIPAGHPLGLRYGSLFWDCRLSRLERWIVPLCVVLTMVLQTKQVLHSAILYVLDFDLLTPPYDQVNQVTVSEVNELNANMQISTGKRLGFRFQADVEDVS